MSSCCEPSTEEGFSKGVAVGLPEYFGGAGGGGGRAGGAPPRGVVEQGAPLLRGLVEQELPLLAVFWAVETEWRESQLSEEQVLQLESSLPQTGGWLDFGSDQKQGWRVSLFCQRQVAGRVFFLRLGCLAAASEGLHRCGIVPPEVFRWKVLQRLPTENDI
jgi:hypothetical protein